MSAAAKISAKPGKSALEEAKVGCDGGDGASCQVLAGIYDEGFAGVPADPVKARALRPRVQARPAKGASGPAPATGMPPLRIGGVVVTALGGVGIVLGATFGVLAMQRRDESNEPGQCDETTNLCRTAAGVDLRAQSRLFGDLSTATFVIGGLAGAAGIVMLAVPIGRAPVRAAVSPSFIGAEGTF